MNLGWEPAQSCFTTIHALWEFRLYLYIFLEGRLLLTWISNLSIGITLYFTSEAGSWKPDKNKGVGFSPRHHGRKHPYPPSRFHTSSHHGNHGTIRQNPIRNVISLCRLEKVYKSVISCLLTLIFHAKSHLRLMMWPQFVVMKQRFYLSTPPSFWISVNVQTHVQPLACQGKSTAIQSLLDTCSVVLVQAISR